ncbi:MAG: hypothetical protein ABI653_04185 [Bacteroidota bacterium]
MIPKICFFVNLFLIANISGSSQTIRDTASPKIIYFNTAPAFPLVKVPGNFYAENMGFFCKKELAIQKLTTIPIKFRLGSVQYCDALEGKNQMHLKPN